MKKLLAIMVACLVVSAVSVRPVSAASNAEKELRLAGKVKQGIEKLGSGSNTRVEVKLRDKTRLKGYISEISENGFVVTDLKTGASNKVAYADVSQVSSTRCVAAELKRFTISTTTRPRKTSRRSSGYTQLIRPARSCWPRDFGSKRSMNRAGCNRRSIARKVFIPAVMTQLIPRSSRSFAT